jgi:hypothetical protein
LARWDADLQSAEKLVLTTSGVEALVENKDFIAALKAVRHSKSNLRQEPKI